MNKEIAMSWSADSRAMPVWVTRSSPDISVPEEYNGYQQCVDVAWIALEQREPSFGKGLQNEGW